jgi:hypothetical protein
MRHAGWVRLFRRWPDALALLALFALAPTLARANQDSFPLSHDAALMGGAVTAFSHDAGGVWYNPAGLGANTRSRLELSGNAFVLRQRGSEDFVRTALPDGTTHRQALQSTEILPVPTVLALARRLIDGLTLGFGVYITTFDQLSLFGQYNKAGTLADGTQESVDSRVNYSMSRTTYHIGPSIGWQPIPNLRVGVSLFAAYAKSTATATMSTQINRVGPPGGGAETGRFFGSASASVQDTTWGLLPVIGLQWEPMDRLHIGLVARMPTLLITQNQNRSGATTVGYADATGLGPNSGEFDDERGVSSPTFEQLSPARFVLALGYSFPAVRLDVEGDIALPNTRQTPNGPVKTDWTWNVRAGVKGDLSQLFTLGGGLFTDRALGPSTGWGEATVDWYGASFGGQYNQPWMLLDKVDPLVFRMMLAVRYAVAVGQMTGLYNPLNAVTAPTDEARALGGSLYAQPVVFHDFQVQLGTGLDF